MHIHSLSASSSLSSESRALLSDAESDSDGARLGLSEGPSCFRPRARTPKAPQPSRPCRSTGSAQAFFLIPGLPASRMPRRHGPARPPPHSNSGPPLTSTVDPHRSAALAAHGGRPNLKASQVSSPPHWAPSQNPPAPLWVLTLQDDDAPSQVERNAPTPQCKRHSMPGVLVTAS
jgi:hypothetical protein